MSGNLTEAMTVEAQAARKQGFKKLGIVGISLLIEITLIILLFTSLGYIAEWVNIINKGISLLLVLIISGQRKTSSIKISWIILILVFPILGLVLYVLIGLDGGTRRMRKRYEVVDRKLFRYLPDGEKHIDELYTLDKDAGSISKYIKKNSSYPLYDNTDVTYYETGLKGLEAQLEAMSKARRFIFMEYHAIEDKKAWKMIEDVLVERARAGVEVRVFYDDMGSIFFITKVFAKRMESLGIACRYFNPVVPILNFFLNNRDHRKITVIDGKVAFTGGYNLADEYFNFVNPYGMWKDTGIKLEGEAVRSLTITFLEMWNAVKSKDHDDINFDMYLPNVDYKGNEKSYIQPYADSPLDKERVGEEVYINIVNRANDYCYFMSPYLIISDEMMHAFRLAAKRGVDVRVITPGIPDKKMVYGVTRSFYHDLTEAGVRIYEWTPGFCHAKMSIADDKMATVGTINLDYRSLYHHFENGCFMYGTSAVEDIKNDFLSTIDESREVTEEYRIGRKKRLALKDLFLRLFASLM